MKGNDKEREKTEKEKRKNTETILAFCSGQRTVKAWTPNRSTYFGSFALRAPWEQKENEKIQGNETFLVLYFFN